jgi:hypothetical protein
MEDFIERANIANFTERLKTEADPTKRALLQALGRGRSQASKPC